ncbi:MAG: dimethylsulfoniopropionate demethylase [Arenicellales bacterium]
MTSLTLLSSRRIRSTPYKRQVENHGVSGYTVVNHTILPKGFRRSVEEDYWHLREHVQLWDVGCQRQVEVKGPDATKLMQLMTPRDLGNAFVGQCLYAPLVDHNGGMLNDPVVLKLSTDRYWISMADSDVLLWVKGLAYGLRLDVDVSEPDVWPMAVQGPKADDLMAAVFGPAIRKIKFFNFDTFEFESQPLVIARSGFSKQGGFEIYLDQPTMGDRLWSTLWQAGQGLEVSPGCPNLIERIESGLLSYGNDMTLENNPLECGLERFCQLDGSVDFIGREALQKIHATGPERSIRGVKFGEDRCPPCSTLWPVRVDDKPVGYVTSAIWSPRFKTNVGLAMIERGYWEEQQRILVEGEDRVIREGELTSLPM